MKLTAEDSTVSEVPDGEIKNGHKGAHACQSFAPLRTFRTQSPFHYSITTRHGCPFMQSDSPMRVAVVGAGVIGLVTALLVAREKDSKVTVLADSFSSYWNIPFGDQKVVIGSKIVSDVAAASFIPHSDESPLLREWLMFSSQFYAELSKIHHDTGVEIRKGREFVDEARRQKRPWYADCVFNMTPCIPRTDSTQPGAQDEVVYLPPDKKAGWSFETFLIEPRFFIPWLRRQLEELHVTFKKELVKDLRSLHEYDVVVNCTGLGSKELAKDSGMAPIVGQILLLQHSGLDQWVRDSSIKGSIGYVYPQRNTVVVGGTKSNEPNKDAEALKAQLKTKGATLQPLISHAPEIGLNSGQRPGRDGFRVEIDKLSLEEHTNGLLNAPLIIHNYGHSGEGYCFAPGCANHIVKLIVSATEKELIGNVPTPVRAKL